MEETLLLNTFLNKCLLFLPLSCHFFKDFTKWLCGTWNQKQTVSGLCFTFTSSELGAEFLTACSAPQVSAAEKRGGSLSVGALGTGSQPPGPMCLAGCWAWLAAAEHWAWSD